MRLWLCILAMALSFALGQMTAEKSWYNRPPPKAVLRGVKVTPVNNDAEVGGIMVVGLPKTFDANRQGGRFWIHDCYFMRDKDDVEPPHELRWYSEP